MLSQYIIDTLRGKELREYVEFKDNFKSTFRPIHISELALFSIFTSITTNDYLMDCFVEFKTAWIKYGMSKLELSQYLEVQLEDVHSAQLVMHKKSRTIGVLGWSAVTLPYIINQNWDKLMPIMHQAIANEHAYDVICEYSTPLDLSSTASLKRYVDFNKRFEFKDFNKPTPETGMIADIDIILRSMNIPINIDCTFKGIQYGLRKFRSGRVQLYFKTPQYTIDDVWMSGTTPTLLKSRVIPCLNQIEVYSTLLDRIKLLALENK